GIAAHERWSAERRATIERGSVPSMIVRTVTGLAVAIAADAGVGGLLGTAQLPRTETGPPATQGPEQEGFPNGAARPDKIGSPVSEIAKPGQATPPPVTVEQVPRNTSDRPGGRRFGALVHAVLATVDFQADEAGVRAMALVQSRTVGATVEETTAAVQTVLAVLAHPILRRAAMVDPLGRVQRETPIFLRLEDGSLVEGVLDLAIREEVGGRPCWTVVDFKTDREIANDRPRYENQVRLYAMAVSAATGEPARGVLLVI